MSNLLYDSAGTEFCHSCGAETIANNNHDCFAVAHYSACCGNEGDCRICGNLPTTVSAPNKIVKFVSPLWSDFALLLGAGSVYGFALGYAVKDWIGA